MKTDFERYIRNRIQEKRNHLKRHIKFERWDDCLRIEGQISELEFMLVYILSTPEES
jgi:uncharacterized protein YtpQ (UPF0354 family)